MPRNRERHFSQPVTLKVYVPNPDGSVGRQIAQMTQTFKMPYRPSTNLTKCKATGGWYSAGKCYNGKLFKITFTVRGVYLSENAIISVAYNTSHYGANPIGTQPCNSEPQGCPYDSLNVALTGTPTVGSFPRPDDAYLDSSWSGAYCNAEEGTGTFRASATSSATRSSDGVRRFAATARSTRGHRQQDVGHRLLRRRHDPMRHGTTACGVVDACSHRRDTHP